MKLLFICTHNRCRSIMCEAIANSRGEGRLEACSAGSTPATAVHPLTLRYLDEAGFPIAGLNSKSWFDLEDYHPDLLITVCDSAAGESCPIALVSVPRLHWGLADPSAGAGSGGVSGADTARAFNTTITEIEARTRALLALPLDRLSGRELAKVVAAFPEGRSGKI